MRIYGSSYRDSGDENNELRLFSTTWFRFFIIRTGRRHSLKSSKVNDYP
jgi:hypothetical protein